MTMELITSTNLWGKSLAPQHDAYDEHRKLLREAFENFRDKAASLVSCISADMKGYTVHDISHLDALWEMADLISGEDFQINPAEAFVFGGAVLLHDAGMSLAAYQHGIDELKETNEWKDCASAIEKDASNSAIQESILIPQVLRNLHASKAKDLATQPFKASHSSEELYLLDNSDLRNHYGALIGAIAQSHHFNHEDLYRLISTLGSFGNMPQEWAIDVMKIALLLRCADAAHIDHRRAPKLLMAFIKPTGISEEHWRFQDKIAKPQLKAQRLIYTSKSDFTLADVDAWHLCWETSKMIDKELNLANNYFLDKNISFEAKSVLGADSASLFAQYVRVDGWKPIATEIQVSDVPHLAKTLGGKDLYSSNEAPIRELIQNAADSIEARIAFDPDFSLEDASITVRVETQDSEPDWILLSVEDNGIGMSERVLTTSLLDFGKSFWRSDAARTEFPGLQSKFEARGRYGIGFFSVFMWSNEITVSTRRFNEGIKDVKVLSFRNGMMKRPIVRNAIDSDEYSNKFQTKIKLKIKSELWKKLFEMPELPQRRYYREASRFFPKDIAHMLARLTACLSIKVTLIENNEQRVVNIPNWKAASSTEIYDFLSALSPDKNEQNKKFINYTPVIKDQKIIGRVSFSPNIGERSNGTLYIYDKGIFVTQGTRGNLDGFIEGKASNAARDRTDEYHNLSANQTWVESQKKSLSEAINNIGESLACQNCLIETGTYLDEEPLFLLNRETLSPKQLKPKLEKMDKISFSLYSRSGKEGSFTVNALDRISPIFGSTVDTTKLYFLCSLPVSISEDENLEELQNKDSLFAKFFKMLTDGMGPEAGINKSLHNEDDYTKAMIMRVEIVRKK